MVEVPHRLAMHVGMQVKLLLEQAKVMPVLPHGHAPSLIEVNWLLLNDLQMCGGAAERRAAQKGYTPESGQAFAAPGQCKKRPTGGHWPEAHMYWRDVRAPSCGKDPVRLLLLTSLRNSKQPRQHAHALRFA